MKNDRTIKLLEKSIKNLRENLDSLSLDSFVGTTIEALMNIERTEYIEKINAPKKDQGNGGAFLSLWSFTLRSPLFALPHLFASAPATA